jgi:hypothetical protein
VCSGLNPTLKIAPSLNIVPILIGAVAGGTAALLLAIVIGSYYRSVTRKYKMFTPEELAILANSQAKSGSLGSPISEPKTAIGSRTFSDMSSNKLENGSVSSNPKYQPGAMSPASSTSNLTPYQRQYLAQQEAIAKGAIDPRQSRVAPSLRASQMVQRAISAPVSITATATPLVVIYEFIAERDDELTAMVGDKMYGIEQQDGWWLAQNSKGVMGLIPVSYTAVDAEAGPGPSNSNINPNF